MKKHTYAAGAFALAFLVSGLPVVALAEDNSGSSDSVSGEGSVGVQVTNIRTEGDGGGSASVTGVAHTEDGQSAEGESTTTMRATGLERALQVVENTNARLHLELEASTTLAHSLAELKQSIEKRKGQLDQEEASTTTEDRDIVKDANPVRLAVHALLASKDLLGGIGSQVSAIAKQMNDSVATTTNAEATIQSRGFLTKLLFGGDSASADVIAKEVAQNQQRIDDLTKLLNGANVSADVQATLSAQITALKDAQTRLTDLAQKEKSLWGLFSWRF